MNNALWFLAWAIAGLILIWGFVELLYAASGVWRWLLKTYRRYLDYVARVNGRETVKTGRLWRVCKGTNYTGRTRLWLKRRLYTAAQQGLWRSYTGETW